MWMTCWDQSNLSLQNLPRIFLWWSCFWKYLEDGKTGCPHKKVVLYFFRKACADWSACQISNLWDQSFTCLQINGQMLDPLDPRNILCNIFAVFLLFIVVIVVAPQWSVLESSLLNLEPDNKCPTPRVGGSSISSNTHKLCLTWEKKSSKYLFSS